MKILETLKDSYIYFLFFLIILFLILEFITYRFTKEKIPFLAYLPIIFKKRKFLTETGKKVDNYANFVLVLFIIAFILANFILK